jgi:recombination protein RecR
VYTFPRSIQKLIREFQKLPSVGEKSATRLAYHIVNNDPKLAETLAAALVDTIQSVQFCKNCFALTDTEECSICMDDRRDSSVLCVVEKPMDVLAFERVGEFRGRYHVLHGVWAPLRGQGPETMKLNELVERLRGSEVTEVIVATGSTVEGDATALYVARLIEELGIRTSRLAQGMPKGGELEYLDDVTLARALSGRLEIRS